MKGPRPEPLSGAPLDPAESTGSTPYTPSYEIGGLLGRGGMGEVHVARDPQLGRDVALKTPHRQDPAAAEQLSREARLTALLEHPNIVPIYGVGRDASGEPWCAMRLLPGRSLADALRESTEPLRLVRHLLDAAGAIAYAHGRGVLHRDLKPSNIMVGGFGETVVTDWGLACTLSEAARSGPVVGTPGYMSPEQRRGEPIDTRSDVYGLGAVLFEILTGTAPPEDGKVPAIRAVAPDAPPELVAIAEQALQADPSARYASVRAMAEDLTAWFEGRQVAAHAYTLRELLARQLSALRVPLTIGFVGLAALIVAIGVGWYRNAMERERAQASEKRALAASAEAEQALADALLAQAQTAAAADHRMEAEIFAVNALLRRPSPEARGVLAHFGGRPRLSLVGQALPVPRCPRRALSPAGDRLLCGDTEGVALYDLAAPTEPIATASGKFGTFDFTGESGRALMVDTEGSFWLWQPPAAPTRLALPPMSLLALGDSRIPGKVPMVVRSTDVVVDVDALTLDQRNSCGPGRSATYVAVSMGGGRIVTCSDRRVLRTPAVGEPEVLTTLTEEEGTPFIVSELDDGRLLVGSVKGGLIVLAPDGQVLDRQDIGSDAIAQFAVSGSLVAVRSGHGEVAIWSGDQLEILARHANRDALLAWVGREPLLRLVGSTLEDRRIPDGYRPHLMRLPAGVAGLTVSPNGLLVAAGLGDGSVQLLSLVTGEVLNSWRWQDGVAKDVAFSSDGRRLAVATVRGDQRILELPSGRVLASLADMTAKRVGWLRSGWYVLMPYKREFLMWRDLPIGPADQRVDSAFGELEFSGDGRQAAILDDGQGVWRLADGDPPLLRHIAEVPRNVAAAPLGADTLVLDDTALLRLDPRGELVSRWPTHATATDVAVSPDGRLIALGYVDGTAAVFQEGGADPLARLIGHTARVGSLAFSPDGAWLITSAWDGQLRVWSLRELEQSAESLRASITADWGLSVEAALAGVH